ncbi:hypothetical protein Hanom_Chr07g00582891 [Helianthus anomalus]
MIQKDIKIVWVTQDKGLKRRERIKFNFIQHPNISTIDTTTPRIFCCLRSLKNLLINLSAASSTRPSS